VSSLQSPQMFIGHVALGLAAKRAAPRLSLALLIAAAQFADMLWPILIFAGIEEVRILPGITKLTPLDFVSYPWSHSLVMLIAWGLLLGWIVRRRDPRALPVVAALVVSHWVLDFMTHRPDMPLYPGGPKFGLGLWNSLGGTLAVELPLFLAGTAIYFRTTRARDNVGTAATFILLALLLAIYAGDIMSDAAPPSATAIGIAGVAGAAIFTAWSWWADHHREVRP
jgi:membrane-bound metal-dependent hydrolase YbcI (DUF457 family)